MDVVSHLVGVKLEIHGDDIAFAVGNRTVSAVCCGDLFPVLGDNDGVELVAHGGVRACFNSKGAALVDVLGGHFAVGSDRGGAFAVDVEGKGRVRVFVIGDLDIERCGRRKGSVFLSA